MIFSSAMGNGSFLAGNAGSVPRSFSEQEKYSYLYAYMNVPASAKNITLKKKSNCHARPFGFRMSNLNHLKLDSYSDGKDSGHRGAWRPGTCFMPF
jgi:hypothetical protein